MATRVVICLWQQTTPTLLCTLIMAQYSTSFQPDDLWSYLNLDPYSSDLLLRPNTESMRTVMNMHPVRPLPAPSAAVFAQPTDSTMGGMYKPVMPANQRVIRPYSPRNRLVKSRGGPILSTMPKAPSAAKERIRQNIHRRLREKIERAAVETKNRKKILDEEHEADELARKDLASGRGRKSRFDRDICSPRSKRIAPNMPLMMVPVPMEELFYDFHPHNIGSGQSGSAVQIISPLFDFGEVTSPATSMGSNNTFVQSPEFTQTDFDQYFVSSTMDFASVDDIFTGL
ncbi:hypothetical protein PSACC_00582 [Paramicrosporidium saccamoebae]|uniref:Uncharacterized protein n=1 Tax=Paramicrosporidium saccamoebae TaxID=1246581 RepID=A0A2H9TPC8_9FUNG|nr:hypothetical protein PSACC_00582 [Paramicrosporidium saccamoebae]